MITADYHVHSAFSTDSTAPMEEMVEKAIALGLERICFTDHMDYDYPGVKEGDFTFQPDEYLTKLTHLTKQYKDKIKILHGIELGLKPYLKERYDQLLQEYPFDFVIGSSHLVDNEDPYFAPFWQNRTDAEGLRRYFETIKENALSFDNFDVYGHLDYIIRYVPSKNTCYDYDTHETVIEEALKAIIETGKGIEVNTSGYKYGLGHAHPKEEIIKRYLELGGTIITIGSDAHKPEHLAYDFTEARNMLQSLGVKEYTVFENRTPIFLPL